MKSLLLLSWIPLASTLTASVAIATDTSPCDLLQLTPLLSDPDLTDCAIASGLTFPPTGVPITQQITTLCGVPACVRLVAKVDGLNLGECTLGPIKLTTDLLAPTKEACANAVVVPVRNSAADATTRPVTVNDEVVPSLDGSTVGNHAPANASDQRADTTTIAKGSSTLIPTPVATTSVASSRSDVVAPAIVILFASVVSVVQVSP